MLRGERVTLRTVVREDLRRVCLEVHSANERGTRAYRSCGFVEEGRMRGHVWLGGRYVDNVIMGVLREEREG